MSHLVKDNPQEHFTEQNYKEHLCQQARVQSALGGMVQAVKKLNKIATNASEASEEPAKEDTTIEYCGSTPKIKTAQEEFEARRALFPEPWPDSVQRKQAIHEAMSAWADKTVEPAPQKLTGGSSMYYRCRVDNPTSKDIEPYTAELNDLLKALGCTYAEGNTLKAIWRICKERLGEGKANGSIIYDAEKALFFSKDIAEAAGLTEEDIKRIMQLD